MRVECKRTVASPRQFASAFLTSWLGLGYDAFPTQAQCGVIYAQWMVETSGAACWNWNIGNVKVTPGQVAAGVPWFDLPGTWEIIDGRRVVLPEGHPGRRFRAYASLDEGMGEHLRFLRNVRYASSWAHVEAGDPRSFAHELKARGYYTAPVEDYARIMVAAFDRWMVSPAFPDALAAAHAQDEVDTVPDGLSPSPVDFQIVHPMPDTVWFVRNKNEPDDVA